MGICKCNSIYKSDSIYNNGGDGAGNTIGGRTYRTVTINGVTWLAENLDFKFCEIGGVGSPLTPNAWYYNDDEPTYGIDGIRKCGLLYNWFAVEFLNNNRNDLIHGWHVPTRDEWEALSNAVGGTVVAGTKLKAMDGAADGIWPTGWNGTDEYGFKIFPGGNRVSGSFDHVGARGRFWTLTDYSSTYKCDILFDTGASMDLNSFSEPYNGFSVRLVKD